MTTIPVFFSEKQVAPVQGYSPSAAKPAQVMAEWKARGFPIEVHGFTKTSKEGFALAHDRYYVRDVLECREANGFGTKDRALADSLPYTTGSMVAAARGVWTSKRVAVSPTSGFHHAGYDHGGGYCTFNGLIVAARVLLAEGAPSVGILDCDQHYGDGTDAILGELTERHPADRSKIHHCTLGEYGYRAGNADKYLATVADALRLFVSKGVGVVLYQAGADPHVNDPLGGTLTSAELRARDALVFETCKAKGLPVAWNLAGGYQRDARGGIQPVLDIHNATMEECVRVYGGGQ